MSHPFEADDESGTVPEEAIDFLCGFASAVINHADEDNVLFEMITEWSPERQVAYQQAIFLYNISLGE